VVLSAASIGNNVQIGARSVVGKRAMIRDNAYLLPDSVLPPETMVPPYSVFGGNPAHYLGSLPEAYPDILRDGITRLYHRFRMET